MSNTILAVNLIGASVAVAANAWAAFTGPAASRPIAMMVATLAGVYVALYVLTLTGFMAQDTRSAIAQGISPVAWLLVWTAPVLRATITHHHNLKALQNLIERVDAG